MNNNSQIPEFKIKNKIKFKISATKPRKAFCLPKLNKKIQTKKLSPKSKITYLSPLKISIFANNFLNRIRYPKSPTTRKLMR